MKIRSGNMETPELGTHLARVVGVTDLGHQPGFEYNGKQVDDKWKIELTYELVSTLMKDGRPFHVSEEVTNTDNSKGTLVKRVNSVGGDINNVGQLINTPCMVEYGPSPETGKPKVLNVSAPLAGVPVPELTNQPWFFDMDDADADEFTALHQWRKDKITRAKNFPETELYKELLKEGLLEDDEVQEY